MKTAKKQKETWFERMGLQPWHVGVFAVAALTLLVQLGIFVAAQIQAANAKVSNENDPRFTEGLTPGTNAYLREVEK